MLTVLESLNYRFRNPKNIIWVIYRIKQLRNYKKTMGSSEGPSLVNNFDELGLVKTPLTGVTEKTLSYLIPILSKVSQLKNTIYIYIYIYIYIAHNGKNHNLVPVDRNTKIIKISTTSQKPCKSHAMRYVANRQACCVWQAATERLQKFPEQ